MKPILLNLDTNIDTHDYIEMMQGYDYTLECNLYSDGTALDLTGYNVRVEMKLGNSSFIVQTKDVTVSENKVTAILDKDFTNHSGSAALQIVISKSDRVNGSWLINCRIKPSALGQSDDTKSKVDITETLSNTITEAESTKADLDTSIANGNVAKIRSDVDEINNVKIPAINSQLDTIVQDKDGYVSVKSFKCDNGEYVKGDGIHDDTSGLVKSLTSGFPIKVPIGDYKITSKLPLRTNLKLKGEGNNSNFILFLQEDDFCFENTSDNLTRVQIDNLGFTVTTGNTKVGAIKYEKTLRGFKISNIWCSNMEMCIHSGRETFGTTIIENIFTTYFPTTPIYNDVANIYISGNTVFLKNIEVLGSYKYGVKFDNTEVCSLRDFNISGSGSDKIEYAIYCDNAKDLTIDRGWIEDVKTNEHGTGKEYAVYWKSSEGVIDGVLCARGSIFIDNSRNVLLRKNNFYYAGSGLIRLNGSHCKTDYNSIGGGGTFPKEYQDGSILFTDTSSNDENIIPNPTLKYPCDISFIVTTNASIILENNLNFTQGQSADRTLKVTLPVGVDIEGVNFNIKALDYQELYTFVANIKCVSNVKNVYLELPSTMKLRNQSPSCLIDTKSQSLSTFFALKAGFQSDIASNKIKLVIEKINTDLDASILIDSCMCFRGYSSKTSVMNYNNTKMFSKNEPNLGKWIVGDIVYNIDPGNSTNNFVGWVCNYVEGDKSYWKKFGQILN